MVCSTVGGAEVVEEDCVEKYEMRGGTCDWVVCKAWGKIGGRMTYCRSETEITCTGVDTTWPSQPLLPSGVFL